jgi:hypothetical protein
MIWVSCLFQADSGTESRRPFRLAGASVPGRVARRFNGSMRGLIIDERRRFATPTGT